MDLLLRSVKIIDPGGPFHNRIADILIRQGRITAVGKNLKAPPKIKEWSARNAHCSPGWFDLYAHFCDPGFEYKEDLHTGIAAAAAGGFTGVAVRPDTQPPLHSKEGIEYILNTTSGHAVEVFPYGAVSMNLEGNDITGMLDMANAGAVGFTDADRPLARAGLMLRSLLYVKAFDGLVLNMPRTSSVSLHGQMNEGPVSVRLGMPGDPALSEELMVNRDIYLAEYAESRCHFLKISTARSVQLLRNARNRGIPVSASVSSYHLLLDESLLESYDTNYKVLPPLRSRKDINALIRGLRDGTIDAICSDHNPQDIDTKRKEFEYAEHGIINLQTAFAAAWTALQGKITLSRLIELLAINPRKILHLPVPKIAEGQKANLTIFDPKGKWIFRPEISVSKSVNSPLFERELTGKPLAIFNNNQWIIH